MSDQNRGPDTDHTLRLQQWRVYGEGPASGLGPSFSPTTPKTPYTSQDIRFTAKGDTLYAIVLAWPADRQVTVSSLAAGSRLMERDIQTVRLLGYEAAVRWKRTAEGLVVELPAKKLGDGPFALRIEQ